MLYWQLFSVTGPGDPRSALGSQIKLIVVVLAGPVVPQLSPLEYFNTQAALPVPVVNTAGRAPALVGF